MKKYITTILLLFLVIRVFSQTSSIDNIKGFNKFYFNSSATNYLKDMKLNGTAFEHNVIRYRYIGRDLIKMKYMGYNISSLELTYHNDQLVSIMIKLPENFHSGDYAKMDDCAYRADTIAYTLDQKYGKSTYHNLNGNTTTVIWKGHKYTCSFSHEETKEKNGSSTTHGCFSIILLSNRNWETYYSENNVRIYSTN